MTHIELTEKEHHAIEKKIDKYLEVVRNLNTETNYALIVSGDALIHISHDVKHHLAQKVHGVTISLICSSLKLLIHVRLCWPVEYLLSKSKN